MSEGFCFFFGHGFDIKQELKYLDVAFDYQGRFVDVVTLNLVRILSKDGDLIFKRFLRNFIKLFSMLKMFSIFTTFVFFFHHSHSRVNETSE